MNPPITLPPRDPKGHKGTFGTVAVIGGCAAGAVRMVGAPALSALAALRAGCGLARVYAPAPIIGEVLTIAPEATGRALAVWPTGDVEPGAGSAAVGEALRDAHAVVIGPGMGVSAGTRAAVEAVMERGAEAGGGVVVLDADAINALAEIISTRDLGRCRFACPVVLTPHVGEFRRLCASAGLEASNPRRAAGDLAGALGAVVIVKSDRTLVTDGAREYVNSTGSAVLATAGSGDVLAGVVAGLAAQFAPRDGGAGLGLFDLACAGVFAHGLAGDEWRRAQRADGGMLASDLLPLIPGVIQGMRAG